MNNHLAIFEKKPWMRGVVDNLYAADLIGQTILQNKNRIRLILLDTALEVAFKNFLQYELEPRLAIEKKWTRQNLEKVVKSKTTFQEETWRSVEYFYGIRCDLYHEHAGKTLMDSDINDCHKLVLYVINTLFDIPSQIWDINPKELLVSQKTKLYLPINKLKTLEKIIYIIGLYKVKDSKDIYQSLKSTGCRNPPKPTIITTYMKSQSYTHYFVKKEDHFHLTQEGENTLSLLAERHKEHQIKGERT
ncbi:hypothetical protein HYX12_00985 [Candidatus Woesearchaeota archaeon]|nr:hypothetical protein [Candidatus Woesearchaeota archaeon]